jgi:hypothetical protein
MTSCRLGNEVGGVLPEVARRHHQQSCRTRSAQLEFGDKIVGEELTRLIGKAGQVPGDEFGKTDAFAGGGITGGIGRRLELSADIPVEHILTGDE